MNKEETVALLSAGEEAWNSWAAELIRKKEDTEEWAERATACFSGVTIENAKLSGFIFPGQALFKNVTFRGETLFAQTIFRGKVDFTGSVFDCSEKNKPVIFNGAIFKSMAIFKEVKFMGMVEFSAEFTGDANFEKSRFDGIAGFLNTSFQGHASFDNAIFNCLSIFSDVQFKESACFEGAKFTGDQVEHQRLFPRGILKSGRENPNSDKDFLQRYGGPSASEAPRVYFLRVRFYGKALFADSLFQGDVRFDQVQFFGMVSFQAVAFHGNTIFSGARYERESVFFGSEFRSTVTFENEYFGGNTSFDATRFLGSTTLSRCTFMEDASFVAAQWEAIFSMRDVTFQRVPDFEQAMFTGLPKLDNIKITVVKGKVGNIVTWMWRREVQRDPELVARWRELRRMALRGHNEILAQNFYANEVKAGRHGLMWYLKERNFFGLLYQALSNFGQSFVLPLAWWVGHLALFRCIYIWMRPEDIGNRCVEGTSSLNDAAWILALAKGLPGLTDFGERVEVSRACLYGSVDQAMLAEIAMVETLQTVLSATLIALFILAIRNNFRIK